MKLSRSARYAALEATLSGERCVILDGAVATELQARGARDFRLSDNDHWGFEAVEHMPEAVADVHKRYVEAGCDVITTNTYGVLDAAGRRVTGLALGARPVHWMDLARNAVRIARQAIGELGRSDECAVAFSIGGDVVTDEHLKTVQLLLRCFSDEAPDFVLLETLTMLKDDRTRDAIRLLIDAGLPVWVSFRRCRDGVCGIHGQLWGDPQGDDFGRLAAELEEIGIGALLINCLPVHRVSGTLPWLADFTDLPLGVYPNLGRYVDPAWRFDETIGPAEYADMALIWRAEGARILGGCCGVRPAHIAAMAEALTGTRPLAPMGDTTHGDTDTALSDTGEGAKWQDDRGRDLFPLPVPELSCDDEVSPPTAAGLLLWKHLLRDEVGRGKQCLDIGCGAGLTTLQLARNGASQVTALDASRAAVANTLSNAFRNGLDRVVDGHVVDLYTLDAERTYDIVVASVPQVPTDPGGERSGHRPVDYWGRNLFDHVLSILPALLAPGGRALVVQSSLLSQAETARQLRRAGLHARVIDHQACPLGAELHDRLEQIRRVEDASDAYHYTWGDDHVMTLYLLEISRD